MGYHHSRGLLGTHKAPAHQAEVDAIQAQLRADLAAGRRSLFKPAPAKADPGRSGARLDRRIAEELDLVVRELEQLGGILAGDPILLHRHCAQLQSIDRIKQVLGHLGRIVGAGDKAVALDQVTLKELRGRLQRQPLRSITD